MAKDPLKINTIGSISGDNISISQIYAPGAIPLQPRRFNTIADAKPFSVDWIIFSQQSVPFFSRKPEAEAIMAFLNAPEPFRWWAIVGEGGSGKSRLALEMQEHLPGGWEGGFMRKENVNLRDAAAWRPDTHHFWVVDYAASHYSSLGDIIAAWEQLFRASSFKVRLLLLERGYSEVSGWWSELTGAMNSNRAAIVNTLYSPPLILPPLEGHSRAFLDGVAKQLNSDMREQLLRGLASIGDEELNSKSQFGNPLLLLLFAADILAQDGDAIKDDSPDMDTIVERYLGRELDLIRAVSEGAGLNYRSMLCVLFATTSMYPLGIPQEHDIVIVKTGDDQVLGRYDKDGKFIFPTLAEVRNFGIDIDKERNARLGNLARVTGVQDIALYLDVLAEAGCGNAAHYSIQPDLVGETLVRLLLNATGVKMSLKRRRGEIDGLRLAKLVEGCMAMSQEVCATNWARLDNNALLALADHMRLGGKSIRAVLVVLHLINMRRSTKAPFVPQRVFAGNDVHTDAPRVGRYFTKIFDVLSRSTLDRESAKRLARDPDAWVLPYLDYLLHLQLLPRVRLGLIICQIHDSTTLSRLTNLSNFLYIISSCLNEAFAEDRTYVPNWERKVYAELVEAAINFGCADAYPTLRASNEIDFPDPYRSLVSTMIACSYGVINGRLGRKETKKSRLLALKGLAVARKTLALSENSHQLAMVECNAALLKVVDIDDQAAALTVFEDALAAMRNYADAKDFTAGVLDALKNQYAMGGNEAVLIAAQRLLDQAPVRLLVAEQILPFVLDALAGLDLRELSEQTGDALFQLAEILLETTRTSTSEDTYEKLKLLTAAATEAARHSSMWASRLNALFRTANTWMARGGCSPIFTKALLIAVAQRALFVDDEVAGGLPFTVSVAVVERAIWQPLVGDDIAPQLLHEVTAIRYAKTQISPSDGPPLYAYMIGIILEKEDTYLSHKDDFARMKQRLLEKLKL